MLDFGDPCLSTSTKSQFKIGDWVRVEYPGSTWHGLEGEVIGYDNDESAWIRSDTKHLGPCWERALNWNYSGSPRLHLVAERSVGSAKVSPSVPDDDRWPHTCPICGKPAYVGFTKTEHRDGSCG